MSWTAGRATTGSWATGRAVTRRRSQELVSVMRMARALVPLVGSSASDRDAFSPAWTAIEKRVAVGHRLYRQWLSPWLVTLIPPVASHPALVQTAMWSLIVSGVTALATANPEARSRIQEVVAKALPPA